MSDFMTYQQVIDGVACSFPHRESEDTSMNVEAGSFNLLVLHDQILSGKQFGELRFDFVLNGHACSVDALIILNPPPKRGALSDSSPCVYSLL